VISRRQYQAHAMLNAVLFALVSGGAALAFVYWVVVVHGAIQ
jgi:hypothetical protein